MRSADAFSDSGMDSSLGELLVQLLQDRAV